MNQGFIYVLSNQSYPGLLKIGFTTKIPTERADELYTTGVPQPFIIEGYFLIQGGIEMEGQVHRELDSHRHSRDREFFRLDVRAAASAIRKVCSVEYEWLRFTPVQPPSVPKSGFWKGVLDAKERRERELAERQESAAKRKTEEAKRRNEDRHSAFWKDTLAAREGQERQTQKQKEKNPKRVDASGKLVGICPKCEIWYVDEICPKCNGVQK